MSRIPRRAEINCHKDGRCQRVLSPGFPRYETEVGSMTKLQLMTGEPNPHLGLGPAVADRRAERLKGSGAAAFVA